ncbi:MAG: response regulator [Betaproteobacteria bacterium]
MDVRAEAGLASRGRILVVDDDEMMRALVEVHLRNEGYTVELAEDAVVAGRILLKRRPDLLLVDVEMPYWNGLDFAATLRADTSIPFFPIIVMTAHESCAQRARRLGLECLLKPFVKDDLLGLVGRLSKPLTPDAGPLRSFHMGHGALHRNAA